MSWWTPRTKHRPASWATLHELYADVRERLGKQVPIDIRTIRPATDDEIDFWQWHQEKVASEAAMKGR